MDKRMRLFLLFAKKKKQNQKQSSYENILHTPALSKQNCKII